MDPHGNFVTEVSLTEPEAAKASNERMQARIFELDDNLRAALELVSALRKEKNAALAEQAKALDREEAALQDEGVGQQHDIGRKSSGFGRTRASCGDGSDQKTTHSRNSCGAWAHCDPIALGH